MFKLLSTLVGTAIASGGIFYSSDATLLAQANTQDIQFICASGYDPSSQRRVPTTFAWTPRGKIPIIRWKSDWSASAGYTPEVRCDAVSSRFDEAYQKGTLVYLTNGRINNQKVICTTKEANDCDTLLLTLQPEENELIILRQLNNILQGRASVPLEQSSQELKHPDGTPQIYFDLNIETFLDTAPVEEE